MLSLKCLLVDPKGRFVVVKIKLGNKELLLASIYYYFFFNLEKRNFEKRVIAQLKLENGETTSEMKQINKEIKLFTTTYLKQNDQVFSPQIFNASTLLLRT